MQRETETVVVDKVLESHRRSRYKFSQRFFSNSKFQVLLVAILCGLIGGSYLLVKAASTSYSLWSNSTIPRTITSDVYKRQDPDRVLNADWKSIDIPLNP